MNDFTPVTRYWAGAAARANPPIMCPTDNKIYLSHWRSWPLPFQDLEKVTMIWLISFRVTLFDRFRDFFTDRPPPRAIRIFPRQAVMLAGSADDVLCVLIHLRIVMLLLSIFMLCLYEPPTDRDGVEFIQRQCGDLGFLAGRPWHRRSTYPFASREESEVGSLSLPTISMTRFGSFARGSTDIFSFARAAKATARCLSIT